MQVIGGGRAPGLKLLNGLTVPVARRTVMRDKGLIGAVEGRTPAARPSLSNHKRFNWPATLRPAAALAGDSEIELTIRTEAFHY